EHQLAFIEILRLITEGRGSPEEAGRAYHGILQAKKIKPHRPLEEGLKLTDNSMSYDGRATQRAQGNIANNPLAIESSSRSGSVKPTDNEPNSSGTEWPKTLTGSPDFDRMTPAQRRAYHSKRLDRIFR